MKEYTIQMDADFLGQYPLKTFSKGTILFEKGKELEYLYYLVDGMLPHPTYQISEPYFSRIDRKLLPPRKFPPGEYKGIY